MGMKKLVMVLVLAASANVVSAAQGQIRGAEQEQALGRLLEESFQPLNLPIAVIKQLAKLASRKIFAKLPKEAGEQALLRFRNERNNDFARELSNAETRDAFIDGEINDLQKLLESLPEIQQRLSGNLELLRRVKADDIQEADKNAAYLQLATSKYALAGVIVLATKQFDSSDDESDTSSESGDEEENNNQSDSD